LNQGTKQRIVGTVVLLALALIFLPIIFDGQGSYQTPLSSRIPDMPVINLMPEPTPTRPALAITSPASDASSAEVITTAGSDAAPEAVADTNPTTISETASAATTSTTTASVDTTATQASPAPESATDNIAVVTSEPAYTRDVPTLDANGLPQGWSVRLGSFSDAANASNLLQRLLADGYRAYTRQLMSGQTELTAVFVGPWIERERVAEYQKELQDKFQLSGMVVRYQVEQIQN